MTKVFGNKVGIYHSKFNDQERIEIWSKVMNFKSDSNVNDSLAAHQLVVGARSALFLPLSGPWIDYY